jgi:hypothetical protein
LGDDEVKVNYPRLKSRRPLQIQLQSQNQKRRRPSQRDVGAAACNSEGRYAYCHLARWRDILIPADVTGCATIAGSELQRST